MPEWVEEFLTCKFLYRIGAGVWNVIMGSIGTLLGATPETFNGGGSTSQTWRYVTEALYPWMLSIGVSMLNLFLIIAMCRAATNLHGNITLELCIEALIKIVIVNAIFLNLLRLMQAVLRIPQLMVRFLTGGKIGNLTISLSDWDVKVSIATLIMALLFLITALICSGMILFTVYSRFLKLYLLVAVSPLAVPPLAGGQRTEQTFYAFVKTFLLYSFEIVVITLTLTIAGSMMSGGFHFLDKSLFGSITDQLMQLDALNAIFVMILSAASVKGASSFLSKAFAL